MRWNDLRVYLVVGALGLLLMIGLPAVFGAAHIHEDPLEGAWRSPTSGWWTVTSTQAVVFRDLHESTALGLQIYTDEPEPAEPVVEWSHDREHWQTLDASLGPGDWVARREFRTWTLKLPEPQEEPANRLIPMWLRIQGMEGMALVLVRL